MRSATNFLFFLYYSQDAPVTAYYLWLPFLLTFCFGFAKVPRTIWRNFLEGNMIKNIIEVKNMIRSII